MLDYNEGDQMIIPNFFSAYCDINCINPTDNQNALLILRLKKSTSKSMLLYNSNVNEQKIEKILFLKENKFKVISLLNYPRVKDRILTNEIVLEVVNDQQESPDFNNTKVFFLSD